jgi:hypothetical protein
MPLITKYPSKEAIDVAVEQKNIMLIAQLYRFLRSPENDAEVEVNDAIVDALKTLGGFTPAISKRIGWD